MKIKTLITLYNNSKFTPVDSEIDVSDSEGKYLIDRGFAVSAESNAPPAKTVTKPGKKGAAKVDAGSNAGNTEGSGNTEGNGNTEGDGNTEGSDDSENDFEIPGLVD